jgi:hypothetical protein
MSAEYTGWAVQLTLASASPVLPVVALGNPPNVTTTTDESGTYTTLTRSVQSVAPQITFTTKAVDRALSVIGQYGVCIDSLTPGTLRGLTAFYKRLATCQDQTVASNAHSSRAMLAGGVFPLTLSAGSRGESLRLSVEANGSTDGTNGSLALSNAATLPTFAAADKFEYILAACQIGGVVMDMTSFNLNFGIEQVERLLGLGSLEPETAGSRRVSPVIEVAGRDLRLFAASGSIGLSGVAATHANTEFWFKRRVSGGGLVADGTAAHFVLTMSGLVTCTEGGSASGSSSATTGFRIESIDDGTNAPLVFAFAQAYVPSWLP